jgi:T5SS/PEP-CTERM-associated repeat protein
MKRALMHAAMRTFVLGGSTIGVVATGALAVRAHAVDFTWIGSGGLPPGDGVSFADPLNWSPTGVPGLFDRAIFEGEGGAVVLTAPLTLNQALVIRDATPPLLLDVSGEVYRLTAGGAIGSTRSLIIGESAGESVSGTLVSGTLQFVHGVMGQDATSVGAFNVSAGSLFTASGDLTVGEAGSAGLLVEGVAALQGAVLGAQADGLGSMDVSGAAALWIGVDDLVIGDEGQGTFDTNSLAIAIAAADVSLGRAIGSVGLLAVSDAGTLFSAGGSLFVGGDALGSGGAGFLSVVDGGELDVGDALIARPNALCNFGSGAIVVTPNITLDGGNLTLASDASVTVADGGVAGESGLFIGVGGASGELIMSSEASLFSEGAMFGRDAGSGGSATISDALWFDSNFITIGSDGAGSMDVLDGGLVIAPTIDIGVSSEASATVGVANADSALQAMADLTIGRAADPDAGRAVTARLTLEDAGTSLADGTLAVRQGGALALRRGFATASSLLTAPEGRMEFELFDPHDQVLVLANVDAVLAGGAFLSLDPGALTSIGATYRLVQSPDVSGEFAVALAPLLDSFRFVNIVEEPGPREQVNAVVTPLPIKVAVDAPTEDPVPNTPNRITAARLGKDDLLDVAVTAPGDGEKAPGSAVILMNNLAAPGGTPGFDIAVELPVGVDPSAIVPGDFSGDGMADLAVSNRGSDTVTLIRNTGGSLAGPPFAVDQTLRVADEPTGVALADMDGDRAVDVVVSSGALDAVEILFNDGAGMFSETTVVTAGTAPKGVCPLDIDNDKDIDIVTVNKGGDGKKASVAVILSSLAGGGGKLTFEPPLLYAIGAGPVALAEGDLNGDGLDDIITANADDQSISVLVNLGRGLFTAAVDLPCGGTPTALAAADLDDDISGDLDLGVLIVDAKGDPGLTVFRNDSTGATVILTLIEDAQAVLGLPTAIVAGDADADGPDDLITAGAATLQAVAGGASPAGGGVGAKRGGAAGKPTAEGAVSVFVSDPIVCVGSLNGDGEVDGSDLGVLLAMWGPCGAETCIGDLDQSGEVDSLDLGLLLANWGPCE